MQKVNTVNEDASSVPPSITPPIIPEQVITPKETWADKIKRVNKESIIKDSEGRNMFFDEEKSYRELSMSGKELEDFIQGKDPNDYFHSGLAAYWLKKSWGDPLPLDREEVISLHKVLRDPGFIMYKHPRYNQYTILIPKKFAEYELDENNEFVSKYTRQDTRVVAFTGQMGVPPAFEERWFELRLNDIRKQLKSMADKRGYTLA